MKTAIPNKNIRKEKEKKKKSDQIYEEKLTKYSNKSMGSTAIHFLTIASCFNLLNVHFMLVFDLTDS